MDIGLIVDVETTGLNSEVDKIIEIGILEFSIESGKEPMITEMYSALEDPEMPLSQEISNLTGITDEMLFEKKIDWQVVKKYFDRASIVIAHNADFDAGFLQKRPELDLTHTHWACSCSHIDWQAHGFRTRSLNYLAADHGFVNPFAHRALFDCATTFRIVGPYMDELITRSYEKTYYVYAVGSAFEMKDRLKARRYRWDAQKRCWYRPVPESQLDGEREFLKTEIYMGESRHQEIELSSL